MLATSGFVVAERYVLAPRTILTNEPGEENHHSNLAPGFFPLPLFFQATPFLAVDEFGLHMDKAVPCGSCVFNLTRANYGNCLSQSC